MSDRNGSQRLDPAASCACGVGAARQKPAGCGATDIGAAGLHAGGNGGGGGGIKRHSASGGAFIVGRDLRRAGQSEFSGMEGGWGGGRVIPTPQPPRPPPPPSGRPGAERRLGHGANRVDGPVVGAGSKAEHRTGHDGQRHTVDGGWRSGGRLVPARAPGLAGESQIKSRLNRTHTET